MTKTALVVGASGIVGNNLARHLLAKGWNVHGLARRPPADIAGLKPVAADLTDAEGLRAALADLRPSHVFICTWMRQATEAENIKVNAAMVRNLLDALRPQQSVQHVALVTGLKHYLGPFEAYGKGALPASPFRESQPRLDTVNFYYAQEDELYAAASRDGFTWSVHRPHTIIGYAIGNAMNMGVTLGVFATICRETGRKFQFPGSAAQWNGLTDVTDARLLARQLEWAATAEHRQWRRVPLELDVGAHCRLVRRGAGAILRGRAAAGGANARLRTGLGGPRGQARPDRPRSVQPHLRLAHRCRSRPADRSGDGHVEKPAARLP
jgi:nucleoside-diphosphate-sugar epimerase